MWISVPKNVMLSPKNGCFIKRDVKCNTSIGLSRIAFKHVSGVPWENSGLRTCCVAFDNDDDLLLLFFILSEWLRENGCNTRVTFISIYWNSGYCFSRALIHYSISGYPVLFTDSPPAPPIASERRQTRVVRYEQNRFPVCCRSFICAPKL